MVQSYQSPVRVYKNPFELIMTAYERRFPTCDMIPIMAHTEIIKDEKSKNGEIEVISRRCKLHCEVPYLLKKIMGVEYLFFVQTNTLNHRERTLEIEAYNESFSSRVVINENCKYSVHPENPDWTCFEQNAQLDVKSFFGFESTVEKIAMKQYSQNISKGKEIINHFLDILKEEGITSVPKWTPPEGAEEEDDEEESFEEASSFMEEDDEDDNVTVRDTESPLRDGLETLSVKETEAETEDGLKKEKETRNSMRKERKDSSSTEKCRKDSSSTDKTRKERKKKDSVSHESTPEMEKTGVSRKVSVGKTSSNSLEDDGRDKLESEYIAKFLGDLTPLQESRLVQLKKWVTKLQKGKVPSDTTLLRFLRARDFHLEKSREMLSQSLLWRKRNQVDKILSDYQPCEPLQKYFPGGWHKTDKHHRPLYLLRLGQMDVKGLVKSVGEENLLRHTLSICEEGLRLTEEATREHGRPITTWTLLVDLEGLNMRHLWRPGIKTLLTIIELVENNYPETMSQVLIIRAPRVFPVLWTLVSTFIDDHTRSKFLFYGGNDYQGPGGLVDYMPEENIPQFLQGKCKCDLGEGGLIPKSLYLPGEEVEVGGKQHLQLSDQSIYQSVSLSRAQVHEVLLSIEEVGAVICWDFDIMKNDVTFSLLRTERPVTKGANLEEVKNTTKSNVKVMTLIGEERNSVIEKTWKEGTDYHMEEKPLLCRDGESIQGSHVTGSKGTYLLQWKYTEASSHASPLDILDSFTAHKAQIMYYFETLKSADYRGSMSSLQSCQSGFSSLSSNTSKSQNSSCPSR